jgi:hypothetical protein
LLLAGFVYLVFQGGGILLSKAALRQIENLTDTDVNADSVEFGLDGSVRLKNLIIKPKNSSQKNILKAEDVYVRFSRFSFLKFSPKLKEVRANRFNFNITHDIDSDIWNISDIKLRFGSSRQGFTPPLISLKNGQLQYEIMQDKQVTKITRIPVEVELAASGKNVNAYDFHIKTAKREGFEGKSELKGIWEKGRVWISGGISSRDLPNFKTAWWIDVLAGELKYEDDGDFSLDLTVKDFQASHKLDEINLTTAEGKALHKIGVLEGMQKFFNRFRPSGRIDVKLTAGGNIHSLKDCDLSGTVLCKDASVYDRKFPYRLNNLEGRIDFTKKDVHIENLSAEHKDVDVKIYGDASVDGFDIHLTSNNMKLNNDLYQALNEKQKAQWDKFDFDGIIDAHFNSKGTSAADKTNLLTVKPLDVNAVYKPFPYPLKRTTGELIFLNKRYIELKDIISEHSGRKIVINGNIDSREKEYKLKINCVNIPADDTLNSVLTKTDYKFHEKFKPLKGVIDADINLKKSGNTQKPDYTAEVDLKDASIKLVQFDIDIENVSSDLVFQPDLIKINSLNGEIQSGDFTVKGKYYISEKNDTPYYNLTANAENIEMSELLGDCRKLPDRKEIFEKFSLKGSADYFLKISNDRQSLKPQYYLELDFADNTSEFTNSPYSLGKINGKLKLSNKQIEFMDTKAVLKSGLRIDEGKSILYLDGQLDLEESKIQKGNLSISADNIPLDENIKTILNKKAKSIYEKLSPTGFVDLNFDNTEISIKNGDYIVKLNGKLKLKNAGFAAVPVLKNIHLNINTKIDYQIPGKFELNKCTIKNGSLEIKNKTVDNLSAEVIPTEQKALYIKDISGDFYGGGIYGNVKIHSENETENSFRGKFLFDRVELEKLFAEDSKAAVIDKKYYKGVMGGSLNFKSNFTTTPETTGNVNIIIENLKAGQVSLLGKMLRIIRRKSSQEYAFEKVNINAYIRDDILMVKNIYLTGEGLNLNGNGGINLSTDKLYLLFAVNTGSSEMSEPGVIGSLTEALSPGLIKIEVKGSIYEPEVVTTKLPLIRDTMNILGSPK